MDDCGVRIYEGGVFFCVWAPFADAVALTGDFNDWSADATPLAHGRDGCWFADVLGAAVGQEYKYIITHGSQALQRNDPRALQLSSSGDSALLVNPNFEWHDDEFALAPREKLVIYELHIGTFARHDPAMVGTFDDATAKLGYLADLGINAIEIMPCSSVWMDRWWGYTPDNLYAIEAAYGGCRAFRQFVQAAHSKGIGVILDVVYNHLSHDPGLDLWQFDGWSENNLGGIYFYNDWRAHTPWGEARPDYGRPEVRRYITDNAAMWLRDCHVDGLRIDATLFIRNVEGKNNDPAHDLADGWKLLQEIAITSDKTKPGTLVIAEDLQGNEWITKPVSEGGAGFGAQWDSAFGAILREVLDSPADEPRDVEKIRFALTLGGNDPFRRVIFSESHDTAAAANHNRRLDESIEPGNPGGLYARKRSVLAAALALTSPGVPMLFQGQEFQESGAFSHYAPLDWGKVEAFAGILLLHKHLIALRQNRYGNTAGLLGRWIDVFHVDAANKVVAYHRWDKAGWGDDVVAVANFANQQRSDYQLAFPATGTWHARFNSDWRGYGADFGDVGAEAVEVAADPSDPQKFIGTIAIGAYSVLIFSQDPQSK